MKKLKALFTGAVSVLLLCFVFAGCNNFLNPSSSSSEATSEPSSKSSDTGKIIIPFGGARNAVVFNADTVSEYKIILTDENSNVSEYTTNGKSQLVIDKVKFGTYKIKAQAFVKEDDESNNYWYIECPEQEVTVSAGNDAVVKLTFKNQTYANTNFVWWNYNNLNGKYYWATNNTVPESFVIQPEFDEEGIEEIPSIFGKEVCIYPDGYVIGNNDWIFTNYENLLYYYTPDKNTLNSYAPFFYMPSSICYDEYTNFIYGLSYSPDENYSGCFERVDASESSISDKNSAIPYLFKLPKEVVITESFVKFAIRKNLIYFITFSYDNYYSKIEYLYKANITFPNTVITIDDNNYYTATIKNTELIAKFTESDNKDVSDDVYTARGLVSDMTIGSDKSLYLLLNDSPSFSGEPKSQGDDTGLAYSRGAIVRIDPLNNITHYGYYDTPRTITSGKLDYGLADEETLTKNNKSKIANNYFSQMTLYAPSKEKSGKYFYGPRKIIAKKPDELYIVDCGVNIILPKGSHSGNAYGHDRIMKFDLKKFGLSVVTEKITAKENGLNLKSIFGYDLVFGSAGIGNKLYDDCVNDNECYLPATLNDEE